MTSNSTDWSTSRRDFLKVASGSALAIAAGLGAAGCGGGASSSASSTAAKPKYGGTLHFGGTGGATSDTLEAQNGLTNQDFTRLPVLYDPLVTIGPTGALEYVLAESITPNQDATEWTIKLRPGVVTHDGKPFGAKDVLYSFKRIVHNNFPGKSSLGPINLNETRVADATTLVVRFDKPFGLFLTFLQLFLYLYMVPEGYDPKHPIGTGPFKLKSFTPGVSSTMVRNPHYWQEGLPYLDEYISTDVADETTQVSGLQSGQFDAITYLSAAPVASLKSAGFNLVISNAGGFEPFTMRVDAAPFSDVRVRQALRLVVDRPQMLQSIFAGYGRIANDMFGVFDPLYDHSIPQRVQDIPQAKSLLKSAGHSSLSVELVTSDLAGGVLEAAQVFATQAAAVGMTVKITTQSGAQYFANSYLKTPFSQDNWQYTPYLLGASQETVASAPFNETHFNDPEYEALYAKAYSSTDPAVHRDVVHGMQRIDYERGGLIIPYNTPIIDALAPHVRGDQTNVTNFGLNAFNLQRFWIDS